MLPALAARACARTTAAAGAAVAIVGVRRGDRPQCAPAGASALDRQKALERGRAGAPADAIAARYSGRAAQGRCRTLSRQCGDKLRHRGACGARAADARHSCRIRRSPKSLRAGSRAEVPIVGRIAAPGGAPPIHVSGQIDRLAVSSDTVLIADYKTDRAVPRWPRRGQTLRHPACALSRGAGAALSGQERACGAVVHRRAAPDGGSGYGDGRSVYRAAGEISRPGKGALTPV